MTMMVTDLLPPRVRATLYSILATATALEAIWDLVPGPLEGKVLQSLSVLGFSLALAHVPRRRP